MKKMMMVLSFFVSVGGFAQSGESEAHVNSKEEHSFQDLVGSWRTKGGAGLDIMDSNTVYIVRGGLRKLAVATLSDVNKAPVTFNLTVKDSSKVVTLKGLLMLVGDNLMQWQIFDSETKPASYTSNTRGDMLFLKRIDKLLN
ncbi:MAG: hypothetical protein EOO10_09270 [Chitinophagaceae bacterium]|nr:MAG: hypothetical protein EOO10_09270 [Chitinophagaceae bacterium]